MWTRRQVLAQIGLAAGAVHALDPHELCCVLPAHAQTADKDLFEMKKVADGFECESTTTTPSLVMMTAALQLTL
jgi:hypothetical protein